MFTGKNKEQFEKWCKSTKDYTLVNGEYLAVYMDKDRCLGSLVYWKELPFSMQQGVYLEYLDSVGVYISLDHYRHDEGHVSSCDYDLMTDKGYYFSGNEHPTRQEALTEAFKKADELINEI